MVYGEASPGAGSTANTPNIFKRSDSGLRVHRTSGIVEIPGGLSPAETNEEVLTLRAVRRENRQTFIEEVGDIGGITFAEYHARLLNLLLANRPFGGLRLNDLLEQGFLPKDNPGLPALDDSLQAEVLAKQSAMRLNQAFDRPVINMTERDGRLRRVSLAPYVQFEDPLQFGITQSGDPMPRIRAEESAAKTEAEVEAEVDQATPGLSPEATVLLQEASAVLIEVAQAVTDEPGGETSEEGEPSGSGLEDDLMDEVYQRRPKYQIDLPPEPTTADALAAVLTSKLPITHRQREVLALINKLDPEIFGDQTLTNGHRYDEALKISQANPNIAFPELLGISSRELDTILKDTLETIRRISADAADLIEQAVYQAG